MEALPLNVYRHGEAKQKRLPMSHYEAGHVEIWPLLPRHVIATWRNISSRKRSLPALYISRVSMIGFDGE